MRLLVLLVASQTLFAADAVQTIRTGGLQKPVEVLIDRWGIPHIYAKSQQDLFYAQGWITARDRLFQIDGWRRTGTGHWAEVLGPNAIARDRLARLIRYRGEPDLEWKSYSPDAKEIAVAFTNGINAYIRSLKTAPPEFQKGGYAPAAWRPEDVTARMAGLLMMHNLQQEVDRAVRIASMGPEADSKLYPSNPPTAIRVPSGLDLASVRADVLNDFRAALRGATGDGEMQQLEGSNNWVVSGSRTDTGKPILANDPHRAITLPSLRKTVHLVAPGWNAMGAGEPALPGIALGHNEEIGFGLTIVYIDQMDLFVETLNPADANQYRYKGQWRSMEVEHQKLAVKGQGDIDLALRYTVHGPVLKIDETNHRAYALRWVGAEPGAAGYLAGLRLARAKNWSEFRESARYFKVPSENLVYADRKGNIGWIAAGEAPIRPHHNGLLPVPGDSGDFDWTGYLTIDQHPQQYNPAQGWIATANHNILPPDYPYVLGYNFGPPFRYERIAEVLRSESKHTVEDSRRLQLDVTSVAAREFVAAVAKHRSQLVGDAKRMASELVQWNGAVREDSASATLYEFWQDSAFNAAFPDRTRPSLEVLLRFLNTDGRANEVLQKAGDAAWKRLAAAYGPTPSAWQWGKIHKLSLEHSLPAVARPGDATTPNATGGVFPMQTAGASYREILDLADWDRSISTNVPGESGDPASPHYADLLGPWSRGEYHPLAYTRKAVEKVTVERLTLQ